MLWRRSWQRSREGRARLASGLMGLLQAKRTENRDGLGGEMFETVAAGVSLVEEEALRLSEKFINCPVKLGNVILLEFGFKIKFLLHIIMKKPAGSF